jgi:hypothetical protein
MYSYLLKASHAYFTYEWDEKNLQFNKTEKDHLIRWRIFVKDV